MARRGALVLACVAAVLAAPAPAQAYKLIGKRWPQKVIDVGSKAPRYTPSVKRAVRIYNRARLPVRLRFVRASRSRVLFAYARGRGGGRTGCEGIAGGTGAGYPGIDFTVMRVSVIRSCSSRKLRDLTAVHELGHVLGLGHDNRRCALMNARADVGSGLGSKCPKSGRAAARLRRALLTADDKRGIRRLYSRPYKPLVSARPLFNSTLIQPGDGTLVAQVASILPNAALSFAWDFGDPASGASNTATGRVAQHLYSRPGTYSLRMIVLDSGVVVATRTETVVAPA